MLINNDTIIGYGIGFSDSVEWEQGLILTKFDSSGNLIKSVFILDSLDGVLAVDKHWGKLIATTDGGYAMTAAAFYRESAFLIKVNRHLEVEFIKEYPDTVNRSNYNYKLVEINDGYLLYGGIQRPNYLNNPFIRRVDKYGNTVWFKYFTAEGVNDLFTSLNKINDSTFVAASVEILPGGDASRSVIRIIDWHGNVLKTWYSEPDPQVGYLRHILPAPDGGFITFGVYLIEKVFVSLIVQPALTKFDSDLEIEWVKHFGNIWIIGAVIFHDIEPTPDGNYIGAGENYSEHALNPNSGWLMKFSPQGDSIWSRFDQAPFPAIGWTNTHSFGGVGVLSSGNIVAGGAASQGNDYCIWLVKVTQDGCLDTLFCGLVPLREPVKSSAAVIYPNPANAQVNLQLPAASDQAAEWRLLNLQGQIVQREKLTPGLPEYTFLLKEVPAGMYFWEVFSPEKPLHNGRLIISK